MESVRLPPPLTALLSHGIDYAGLFPPATLDMADTVANYAGYRATTDRWALGRLIVPAARLDEFATELGTAGLDPAGWRVAATLGNDGAADARLVAEANRRLAPSGAAIDAVEGRVPDPAAVAALAHSVAGSVAWYGEVALGSPYDHVLEAIKAHGGAAKIRMGGTTAGLVPSPEAVTGFLVAVVARQLPFKATAGLHHPLRGAYRLTYAADSDSAPMFGYLNLMLATMLAQQGAPGAEISEALVESDPAHLEFHDGGLRWRRHQLTGFDRCRAAFHGFGSCSFREPIDELGIVLAQ